MDVIGKIGNYEMHSIWQKCQDGRESWKGRFIPKERCFPPKGLDCMVGYREMLKVFWTTMIIYKVQICS